MHRTLPALLILSLLAGAAAPALAQPAADPFVGEWQGTLPVGGVGLRLALSVRHDSGGPFQGAMTSIDQGNARIPSVVDLRGDTLVVAMTTVGATYLATVAAPDTLRGTFRQGGVGLPLVMHRVAAETAARRARPQDPRPPYPYTSTDVSFASVPGVRLAGTLLRPPGKGPFPAVVMVTGSGPQDRNEELLNHRPFLVIADYLARHGIASLRYDDRGVARSAGEFARGTSADFADDAEAAVRFLRAQPGIASRRVGILGHSEGAMIGPMVAARDGDVAFLVLLAGPGVAGDSLLILQQRAVAAATGTPPEAIDRNAALERQLLSAVRDARDSADAAARLATAEREFVALLPEVQREGAATALSREGGALLTPWMRYFVSYDPRPALRRVRVPVLALDGTLDVQVPYRENLDAIGQALREGGNPDHEEVPMPGLNHLFQVAGTGAPNEYATIEQTIAPAALERIAAWIEQRFGSR